MSERLELCCKCGCATGKAGAGDGSIYAGDYGPLCEECFEALIAAAPETARKLDILLKAANRALAAMDDCDDFGISEAWGDPDKNEACENLRETVTECQCN